MRINIDIRRLWRTNLSEKQVALSTVPSTTQISLQPLVMDVARLLPQIYCWKIFSRRTMLAAIGPQLTWEGVALRSSPEWPRIDGVEALHMIEPHRSSSDSSIVEAYLESASVLASVMEQCARAGGRVELMQLENVNIETVVQLGQQGALQCVTDEFNCVEVSPSKKGVKWEGIIACGNAEQASFIDEQDESSKISIAVWLRRHGFVVKSAPSALQVGEAKEFALDMRRPLSYFAALCKHDDIFLKGITSIPHDRSDFFYRCLVKLPMDKLESIMNSGETADEFFRKEYNAVLPLLPQGDDVEMAELSDSAAVTMKGLVPITGPASMIETSAWSRAAVTVVDAATGQPVMHKVYFDFQHHSYGQRGFVHCKHPDHGTCIGHAYTQGFASRAEFCAAMHKWASSSQACATREEHLALKPEPSMGRPLPESMVVREF